jgi:hypothetical protein
LKKFKTYPIFINYPETWEGVRLRQRDQFAEKGDYKMVAWLDDTAKELYATMEDPNPTSVARKYEEQVYNAMGLIDSNQLGSLLLDSLNDGIKYWIVPLDYIEKHLCKNCSAYTFPGTPKQGGGERIYFNPSDFHQALPMRYSSDDVLFHEVVHAYRDGEIGYSKTNSKNLNKAMLPDYDTMEEFLALQMQNIYLACRHSTSFYHSYLRPHSISKEGAYKVFANDPRILSVFRYFYENEPLAEQVTRLAMPDDAFNPWRDLDDLEQAYLKTHPHKKLIKF